MIVDLLLIGLGFLPKRLKLAIGPLFEAVLYGGRERTGGVTASTCWGRENAPKANRIKTVEQTELNPPEDVISCSVLK